MTLNKLNNSYLCKILEFPTKAEEIIFLLDDINVDLLKLRKTNEF